MHFTFLYICDESQRNYVMYNEYGDIQHIKSRDVNRTNGSFSDGDFSAIIRYISGKVSG